MTQTKICFGFPPSGKPLTDPPTPPKSGSVVANPPAKQVARQLRKSILNHEEAPIDLDQQSAILDEVTRKALIKVTRNREKRQRGR